MVQIQYDLVIKNNEKTPQQKRILLDTLAGEGVCMCEAPVNHGVHIMYKHGMDVLTMNTSVGESGRIWYTVGITLEHRY